MYALQQTTGWKDRYRIRSGIEATNSELKRAHGIGRLKVRRLSKVCFVVACKIIACNIKRWAKAACISPKRIVQGCMASLRTCLKPFLSDLIRVSRFKTRIMTANAALILPGASRELMD